MIKFFRLPTPREVLIKHQTSAQLDLLEHQRNAEYHAHMVKMLGKRIERIQRQLDAGENAFKPSEST